MRAFGKTCCGTTDVWIEAGIVFCSTCGNEPGEFIGQEDERPVYTRETHNLKRGEDYDRQVVCAKCGEADIDTWDAIHLGITICSFCIRIYLDKEEQKKYLADIEKQKQFLADIDLPMEFKCSKCKQDMRVPLDGLTKFGCICYPFHPIRGSKSGDNVILVNYEYDGYNKHRKKVYVV